MAGVRKRLGSIAIRPVPRKAPDAIEDRHATDIAGPAGRWHARPMALVDRRLPVLLRTLFLGLALLLVGCPGSPSLPTVELKGQRFTVEIADTPELQERGLMFRRDLPLDHGMLFIFPEQRWHSFWMRNCLIPLDIMYFDAEGRFVSAHYNARPCNAEYCPTYPSEGPAKYVLELNGGVGRDLNLVPGDRLTLPELPAR